jgi:hypothetical protein
MYDVTIFFLLLLSFSIRKEAGRAKKERKKENTLLRFFKNTRKLAVIYYIK